MYKLPKLILIFLRHLLKNIVYFVFFIYVFKFINFIDQQKIIIWPLTFITFAIFVFFKAFFKFSLVLSKYWEKSDNFHIISLIYRLFNCKAFYQKT